MLAPLATGCTITCFWTPIELAEEDEQANIIAPTQIAPPKRTTIPKFPG